MGDSDKHIEATLWTIKNQVLEGIPTSYLCMIGCQNDQAIDYKAFHQCFTQYNMMDITFPVIDQRHIDINEPWTIAGYDLVTALRVLYMARDADHIFEQLKKTASMNRRIFFDIIIRGPSKGKPYEGAVNDFTDLKDKCLKEFKLVTILPAPEDMHYYFIS